jgi:hypothetical protein
MSSFALRVRASDKETLAAVLKFLISMYRELSSPLSLTFVARVLEQFPLNLQHIRSCGSS